MHGKRTAVRPKPEAAARQYDSRLNSVAGVMFSVMTARLDVMMLGVAGMAMRGVGMVRGLLMIAGFIVLRGFAVMLRGMLVMLGGLVMMLDTLVLAHVSLPVWRLKSATIT
jgi:hypothetical protein